MPNFTVIEGEQGRGINGPHAIYAVQCFEDLAIELLRDVARDQQSAYRVCDLLLQFLRVAEKADVSLFQIINRANENLHTRAFETDRSDHAQARDLIVRYALRTAAEMMATDGAAAGRASQRQRDLGHAIDALIEGRELRARANGWSYLAGFSEHLGKWRTSKNSANESKGQRAKPRAKPLEF